MRIPLLLLSSLILFSCSKPDYLLLRKEAHIAFQEERYEESMAFLKKVLKKEPKDPANTLLMGQNLLASGDAEASLVYIEKTIDLDPNYADAIAERAAYEAAKGNYQLALQDIDQAISLFPDSASYQMQKGKIFKQAGKTDSAIVAFGKAIELSPKNSKPYQERGYLHLATEAYGDAILDLNQVVELKGADATTYINRGYAKLEIQADSLALFDFEEALILARTNELKGIVLNNLVRVKMLIGDVEGAWKDIRTATLLNPRSSYAFRNKALVLIAMKRYEEACEAIQTSLELGYTTSYGEEVQELKELHCEK